MQFEDIASLKKKVAMIEEDIQSNNKRQELQLEKIEQKEKFLETLVLDLPINN